MFDSALLEHKLDKKTFKEMEPKLRDDLLDQQFELVQQKRRTVLVLVNGPDGSGKGAVTNLIYRWLDARHVKTLAYERINDEERRRPPLWKYWRDMPGHGEIGVVLGSWYHMALLAHAGGLIDTFAFEHALNQINRFEAMLHSEGVELLKLWLYVPPEEAARRREKARKGIDIDQSLIIEWDAVSKPKQRHKFQEIAQNLAYQTSTAIAPWNVVPAADPDYRAAAIGGLLLEALKRANRPDPTVPVPSEAPSAASISTTAPAVPRVSILSSLDLTKTLDKRDYDEELPKAQHRLRELVHSKAFQNLGVVCVFEGNDAAGKGGAIMRLRQALDPRRFAVHPVAAPSDEERARPYLWRFWRNLPARGHIGIFDRSWYGRVLVERVEGFCTEADWRRAYDEINDFESELQQSDFLVVKFWLAISQDEQKRRFEEREQTTFKRFKLTPEDWRNRDKWPAYEVAITDMVDRTSTTYAPWTLVEAENKHYARVKVLKTVVSRIEQALEDR